MSRIGKKAIFLPKDVVVTLTNNEISIKGKYGVLQKTLSDKLTFFTDNEKIVISRHNEEKKSKEAHGLYRALLQNMVNGVDKKFSKKTAG